MRRRLPQIIALIPVLCLGLLATAAAGQGPLAVTTVPAPGHATTVLHRIDIAGATLVPVGDTGYAVHALAFDGSGRLLAVDPVADLLLELDPDSGSATVIGDLGIDLADQPVGLTVDRSGRLWLTGIEAGGGTTLFELDGSSGTARRVGPLSDDALGSLAAVGDQLLGLGHDLYRVDGATAEVKPVGHNPSPGWQGVGLDLDQDGRMWAVIVCTVCFSPGEQIALTAFDPMTGELRAIDATVDVPPGTRGLAVRAGTLRLPNRAKARPTITR